MHFIIFEGSSEERTPLAAGLDLSGESDLEALSLGDTVWVATRLAGEREAPALCGRLRVAGSGPNSDRAAGYDRSRSDRPLRVLIDEAQSSRCEPFACPMVASWEIWRKPFGGLRQLSDEQGRTLEQEWARHGR